MAGVVEVVVEADKAIFLLLLWRGTNVQAVGDPTLAERDWTGLSTDRVRMHLIQVSIPLPFAINFFDELNSTQSASLIFVYTSQRVGKRGKQLA